MNLEFYVNQYFQRLKNKLGSQKYTLRHAQQRLRYGISNYDAWDLDDYLAMAIARGCSELLRQDHGHPCDLSRFQWRLILVKIRDGFEKYAWENGGRESPEFKEAMELFTKWFPHLWD